MERPHLTYIICLFTDNAKCHHSIVSDVTEIYSCASHVVSDVIVDSSPVECASVCLGRRDCAMFAMSRVGSDLSICAVTNGTRSDVDLRDIYQRLYIIEQEMQCTSNMP